MNRAVLPHPQHRHTARGDVAVKNKLVEHPNIVETYQLGNTTVHIASNYFRTDPEEQKAVLEDYKRAAYQIHVNARMRERGESDANHDKA